MKIEGSKVRSERRRERELPHLQHKGVSAKCVPEEQLLGFFFFFLLLSFAIIARLTGPDGITSLPKTHQRESIS